MKVVVRYYTIVSLAANSCREEELTLTERAGLDLLLKAISAKYGGPMERMITSLLQGEEGIIWVMVNGQRVKATSYDDVLREGDMVTITTPLLMGG